MSERRGQASFGSTPRSPKATSCGRAHHPVIRGAKRPREDQERRTRDAWGAGSRDPHVPRRCQPPGALPCVFGVGRGQHTEGRGRGPESGPRDVIHQRHTHAPDAQSTGPFSRRPVDKPWAPCAAVLAPPCCHPSLLLWSPHATPPSPEAKAGAWLYPSPASPGPREGSGPFGSLADVRSLCPPPARAPDSCSK